MSHIFTEISWYWLLLVGVVAGLLSVWLYTGDKRLAHLGRLKKVGLGLLRFTSFFLIGVLLLGILFETNKTKKNKPLLIFNIDNSSSMLNYSDSNEVLKIQSKIDQLKIDFGSQFDFVSYPQDFNSKFDENISNLGKSISYIDANYSNRNIGAVITFSDGNYNEGQNPSVLAERIKFVPFYNVGIGDTLLKIDQIIYNAYANKIAFLGNDFPVEVNFGQFGFDGETSEIQVLVNGKSDQNIQVVYTKNEAKKLSFRLTAKSLGVQHVQIRLKAKSEEYTLENNVFDLYIEVLDSRNKIAMVYGGITPDVGAFQQVYFKNKNVEFKSYSLEKFSFKDEYDLLILHSIPSSNRGKELRAWLEKNKINTLEIVGLKTELGSLSSANNGVKILERAGVEDILGVSNDDFKEFSLSQGMKELIRNAPPLKSKNVNVSTSTAVTTLAFQRLGNLRKKDPLIHVSKQLETKHIYVFGEGLWKWRMLDFQKNKSFEIFDQMIQKMTQYLVVKENKQKLQVTIPNNLTGNSSVVIKSDFYNEAFELITIPEISFDLTDQHGTSSFTFLKNGDHYELDLGELKGGKYDWKAKTTFNDREYTQTGSFYVLEKKIEQVDTRSDFQLLNDISKKSNGQFLKLTNVNQLKELILNDQNISSTSYVEKEYKDLLDYLWLVFVILGLLGLEWFIRKYSGTY